MNIEYLTLLIISFFLSLAVFGLSMLLNGILNNKYFFKKNKKIFLKKVIIKIFQLLLLITLCVILIILPQLLKNQILAYINLFYIPIILACNIVFSISFSIMLSFPISIVIIINFAIVTTNLYELFITVTYQLIALFVANISLLTKKNKDTLSNFIYSFCLFLMLLVITFLFFIDRSNSILSMSIQLLVTWLLYLILSESIRWYKNFIDKIEKISNKKIYENNVFLSSNSANQIIKQYIETNKINFGIVLMFNLINFNKLSSIWGNNGTKYIQKKILDEIKNSFNNLKPLFFMTSNNKYACFIGIQNINYDVLKKIYLGNNKQIRSIDDPCRLIQDCILNIPKIINYKSNKQKINSGTFGSIYGIHSCDINQLTQLCELTQKKSYSSNKSNALIVFNPIKINTNLKYENISKNMHYIFFANNFQITLMEKSIKNKIVYRPSINYVDKLLFSLSDIKNYVNNLEYYEYTIRMVAMQSLKIYSRSNKKYSIIIEYPINYVISDDFSLGDINNKLESLQIKPENIIFKFNLDEMKNFDNKFDNLLNLKLLGFEILFSNFEYKYLNILKDIRPNYIEFEQNNFSKDFVKILSSNLKEMNIKLI